MSDEFEFPIDPTAPETDRPDRRGASRKVLRIQARIVPQGEPPLCVQTLDLSPAGVSITTAEPMSVGLECAVELGISIPALAAPPGLRARVRYCAQLGPGQYRIGMKFTWVSIEAAELLAAVLA